MSHHLEGRTRQSGVHPIYRFPVQVLLALKTANKGRDMSICLIPKRHQLHVKVVTMLLHYLKPSELAAAVRPLIRCSKMSLLARCYRQQNRSY